MNLKLQSLKVKLKVLSSENTKLLKAAQDDVTINIKAEQVNVPVIKKKRPYFKRNKNARPTTSNPKMGKGKQ